MIEKEYIQALKDLEKSFPSTSYDYQINVGKEGLDSFDRAIKNFPEFSPIKPPNIA